MKEHFATFTVLIALSACTSSGPIGGAWTDSQTGGAEPQTASTSGLLFPSDYHGDEVTANRGDKWLAMVKTSSGECLLKRVALSVDCIKDPLLDKVGRRSAKRVSANMENGSALFFVKGIAGLSPGAVHTSSTGSEIFPNVPLKFKIGPAIEYSLCLKCEERFIKHGSRDATSSLVLSRGDQVQVLAAFNGIGNEGKIPLLWAGDLDLDGNLDLLIDISDNYNTFAPALFLSKGAPKGQMVIKAAQHESQGC